MRLQKAKVLTVLAFLYFLYLLPNFFIQTGKFQPGDLPLCFVNETLFKARRENMKSFRNSHLEYREPLNWHDFNQYKKKAIYYSRFD